MDFRQFYKYMNKFKGTDLTVPTHLLKPIKKYLTLQGYVHLEIAESTVEIKLEKFHDEYLKCFSGAGISSITKEDFFINGKRINKIHTTCLSVAINQEELDKRERER